MKLQRDRSGTFEPAPRKRTIPAAFAWPNRFTCFTWKLKLSHSLPEQLTNRTGVSLDCLRFAGQLAGRQSRGGDVSSIRSSKRRSAARGADGMQVGRVALRRAGWLRGRIPTIDLFLPCRFLLIRCRRCRRRHCHPAKLHESLQGFTWVGEETAR